VSARNAERRSERSKKGAQTRQERLQRPVARGSRSQDQVGQFTTQPHEEDQR